MVFSNATQKETEKGVSQGVLEREVNVILKEIKKWLWSIMLSLFLPHCVPSALEFLSVPWNTSIIFELLESDLGIHWQLSLSLLNEFY